MLNNTIVVPSRRRRQPQTGYHVGQVVTVTTSYFGGTRTILGRIKRIAVKAGGIADLPIITFVVKTWEPTHRSIVMSQAEFERRIVEVVK